MRAKSHPLIAIVAALPLAFTLGCGSGSNSSNPGTGGSGATGGSSGSAGSGGSSGGSGAAGSGGSGGTVAQCNQSTALDLTGTWAARVLMTVNLQSQPGGTISICPQNQHPEASLYMLFNIQQDSANPTSLPQIQAHVCSVELPEVTALAGSCDPSATNLVTTQLQIPPALAGALPNIQLQAGSATLDGTAPGAKITSSKVVFVAGATTQDAQLPKWDLSNSACSGTGIGNGTTCDTTCVQSCSNLRDDDGDGYPGITLGVCGMTQSDRTQHVPCNITDPANTSATLQGRAFLDLQIDPTLSGTVKSSCEITGNVNATMVYNLVGADVWLEGGQLAVNDAIKSLPTFTVDPTQSEYRMLRVDGKDGAVNWNLPTAISDACASVVAHKNDF